MNYEEKPLTPEEAECIGKKIDEYAYTVVPPEPGTPEEERLVFKAEDGEGKVIAGCIVNVQAWGRAVLAVLLVDEGYRGHGLASMLIREAERAARAKGCSIMCLGTMDFQARGLYEKHGYTVFTTTEDLPRGHEGYSLSKRLDGDAPDYVPKDNSAEKLFGIQPGGKEDADIIDDGLDRYCDSIVPDKHEYIYLNKKLVDGDGKLVAGIVAGVGGWDAGDIDGLWVEEPYRNRGLGSRLLREAEEEAREKGAYILLTQAADWNVGFFKKHGYTVRGRLEDYPRGHCCYELTKLL